MWRTTIEWPIDVWVPIARTKTCGSDLHMYEGPTDMEPGTGAWTREGLSQRSVQRHLRPVQELRAGADGLLRHGRAQDGLAGAAYRFADIGPRRGVQAEYLRVRWADFNCLRLPEDAHEKRNDYVMLSDIWPTGYHATEMANVGPGGSARAG